ncbi:MULTISPECIES: hypothetical protein [Rhodomicrobium]|uniref:hypothetical protein n=1 Tax=Rhodomicrobium TaxID=1068 RepID=UPI000B4C1559|nr:MULTISPECIES: hypothetical protein [Rhodomicrobium]
MNWYRPCAYDAEQKHRFHREARKRLKHLAAELGFPPGSYDLRSNPGGIAVSGEITLHHEAVYIQICQPATGHDTGIMIRTCQGRLDYAGGRNHYEPLERLGDIPGLARRVREVLYVAAPPGACRRSS